MKKANIALQKTDTNWQNIGNTSCYRFPVGRYKHIFDDFNADPAKVKNMASPRNTSVMLSARWFMACRLGCEFQTHPIAAMAIKFFKTAMPGPNTSVVAFTGKPDPDEAMVGAWPVEGEHWKKSINSQSRALGLKITA